MGKIGAQHRFLRQFFALQKSAEINTLKPYGFNDEVTAKKSNTKKCINGMPEA
jgi:hypothetical protein